MLIKGNGLLWSPKKGKVVARRELETDDAEIIELARAAGWDVDGSAVVAEEKPKRTRKPRAIEDAE